MFHNTEPDSKLILITLPLSELSEWNDGLTDMYWQLPHYLHNPWGRRKNKFLKHWFPAEKMIQILVYVYLLLWFLVCGIGSRITSSSEVLLWFRHWWQWRLRTLHSAECRCWCCFWLNVQIFTQFIVTGPLATPIRWQRFWCQDVILIILNVLFCKWHVGDVHRNIWFQVKFRHRTKTVIPSYTWGAFN